MKKSILYFIMFTILGIYKIISDNEDSKIHFMDITKVSELIVKLGLITILMKKVS